MRFELVERRLSHLPTRLPAAPAALVPRLVPDPAGSTPEPPAWPAVTQREAAVLLLMYPDPTGEARIVLTERRQGNHRHAGQVSLPGGAREEADESIVAAALREACEEVGLDQVAARLRVVGVLAPVEVRVSGFVVHPVVALAPYEPALAADEREVAAILRPPVAAFLPSAPIEIVTARRDGYLLRYGAYRVGRHLVWGATAGILGRFAAFLDGDG
jgi:8-oxo-dGTP pyrophosphatase MutT (NUDIX family)